MVTVFLLYFCDFLKLGQSSHRMWKTKLQTLCLILYSWFGKIFSEDAESVFRLPEICDL